MALAGGHSFLWICWEQAQRILAVYPLENSGFNSVDTQNPWVAAVQLAGVWSYYMPHVAVVLRWLVPAAALGWIVVSGVGRNVVLMRLEPGLRFRPLAMMVLQAAWVALLAAHLLGLVQLAAVGCGNSHRGHGRARPGGLLYLGDLSFAGILHAVCAGELGVVDRAHVAAARDAARYFRLSGRVSASASLLLPSWRRSTW